MTDVNQHTIFYTLPRHQAVIVEYTSDPTKDMYQVLTYAHILVLHDILLRNLSKISLSLSSITYVYILEYRLADLQRNQ